MFAKMEGASYVALSETNDARGKKSIRLGVVDEWYDAKDTKMLEKMALKTNGGFDVVIDCICPAGIRFLYSLHHHLQKNRKRIYRSSPSCNTCMLDCYWW